MRKRLQIRRWLSNCCGISTPMVDGVPAFQWHPGEL